MEAGSLPYTGCWLPPGAPVQYPEFIAAESYQRAPRNGLVGVAHIVAEWFAGDGHAAFEHLSSTARTAACGKFTNDMRHAGEDSSSCAGSIMGLAI